MPLVDETILRRELERMETEGAAMQAASQERPELPPTSARREVAYVPMPEDEVQRLRAIIKGHGLELINDGAVYRVKRQRDFMLWSLAASPLITEERGGGEPHALLETIRRFCGTE